MLSIQARRHVVRTLRATAKKLLAGTVAFPPKMADDVEAKVLEQLATWSLVGVLASKAIAEEQLEILDPKAETKVPAPKLSPAVWKIARDLATAMLAGGGVDGYATGKKPDITKPETASALKKIEKAKTLDDFSDHDLLVLEYIFRNGSHRSNAAQKSAYYVSKFREERQRLQARKDKGADAPEAQDRWSGGGTPDQQRKKLQKEIANYDSFTTYLKSLGGKVIPVKVKTGVGGKKSLSKMDPVKWTQPIDLTGLPKNYPLDIVQNGSFTEITVEVMPRTASFNGAWNPKEKSLTIVSQFMPTTREGFDSRRADIRETLEHELAHMIQLIIRESLASRGNKTASQRAGTPYSPKNPAPITVETFEGNHGRGLQLKTMFPDASERELYFLDPIEFFPQIGSHVQHFMREKGIGVHKRRFIFEFAGHEREEEQPEPSPQEILKGWKEFTNQPARPRDAGFYDTLKKYDMRLWKRAVSEGWTILTKRLDAMKKAAK